MILSNEEAIAKARTLMIEAGAKDCKELDEFLSIAYKLKWLFRYSGNNKFKYEYIISDLCGNEVLKGKYKDACDFLNIDCRNLHVYYRNNYTYKNKYRISRRKL